MTASAIELATGAAIVLAEQMATAAAARSEEGAGIIAKAVQQLEHGAHAELVFRISPDVIVAELGIRTVTGDLLKVGTHRLARRQQGHC